MKALIGWLAGLFGYRPDYAGAFFDDDLPDRSSVGPNGMIELLPGRTLIVEGGLDRPPTFVGEGEAGPNPFVNMILADNTRETNEHLPGHGFLPAPGRTAFSLWVEDGGPSFLLAENANDTPVIYITHLVEPRGDGYVIEPTVTAAVTAKGAGVESRHQQVRAAYIVGMRAVADDELVYDAATGRMRRLTRR